MQNKRGGEIPWEKFVQETFRKTNSVRNISVKNNFGGKYFIEYFHRNFPAEIVGI